MNSKLQLKEDPKEWRKAGLMAAAGIAVGSGVLRYRHVLSNQKWACVILLPVFMAFAALAHPRLFRPLYRFTTRLSQFLSKWIGRVMLAMFFFAIIVPFGWLWRMFGKDPLRLRRPANAETYWTKCRPGSSLDNLF